VCEELLFCTGKLLLDAVTVMDFKPLFLEDGFVSRTVELAVICEDLFGARILVSFSIALEATEDLMVVLVLFLFVEFPFDGF
jgi:hypothetical protein